jgi:hypothetical protein
MNTNIYKINKGINKSIEFKGLKAQYIWYLGAGVMALLMAFSVMYLLEVNTYVSLLIILVAGSSLVMKVYAMSAKYGEHGLSKELAKRRIPDTIKCNSRWVFMKGLKVKANGNKPLNTSNAGNSKVN